MTTLLEWAAFVVLVELAVIMLPLAYVVARFVLPSRPEEPVLPPPPPSPGVVDVDVLRLVSDGPLPYDGDAINLTKVTINTDGAVYRDYRFDRVVDVKAQDVVFENCWFEGVEMNPANTGLLRCITGGSFTATHCTVKPKYENDGPDGVRGSNFTLRFCDISRTVDGVHIYGSLSNYDDPGAGNVLVEDSWLHDFVWYPNDSHSDGTHNDCVQIVGGSNCVFRRNRFSGTAYNAVFMVSQAKNPVAGLVIEDNLIECDGKSVSGGGEQTATGVNLYDKQGPQPVTGLVIRGNVFARGAQKYQMVVSKRTLDSGPVIEGNLFDDGADPGPVVVRGA